MNSCTIIQRLIKIATVGLLALTSCGVLDEATLRDAVDQQYVREHGQLPEEAVVEAAAPEWVSRFWSDCYMTSDVQLTVKCWEPMAGAFSYVAVERFPTEADAEGVFAVRECDEWLDFHGYQACHNYTYRDASEPTMGGHYRITSVIAWQDQHRIFEVQNEFHSTIPTSEFSALGLSERMYESAVELRLIVE